MNNFSENITSGPRQSNFELLRIASMFLVLVVHACLAIGLPQWAEIENNPERSIATITFKALSEVCVNIFVLISGWFGIKPSLKGLFKFVFQCLYFMIGIYLICLLFGLSKISTNSILECFALTSANWFVKAYIALYLLSPVLNRYISSTSLHSQLKVLVAFYFFQTVYGTTNAAQFIDFGYSIFSFIGLYLLGRFLRSYLKSLKEKQLNINYLKLGGVIYCLSTLCNIAIYIVFQKLNISIRVFSYINPLVIAGAVGLLILFSEIEITNSKTINFISASSFGVYLLHTNPNLFKPYFLTQITDIVQDTYGILMLTKVLIFLIFVFFTGITMDLPRKCIWKWINTKFNSIKEYKCSTT